MSIILVITWGVIILCFGVKYIQKKYIYPLKYAQFVYEYADEYGLEKALVFSVIKVESSFNEKATSKKNAIGLMQIKIPTAKFIAVELGKASYDLYDAKTNINFGCYYIQYLYKKFNNMDTALVAYNAGETTVRGWLKDERYSKDRESLYNIPYKESQEYLLKVKQSFVKYQKLYKNFVDK